LTPLPSQQTPLISGDGFMTKAWRVLFEDLRRRLGGSQDISWQALSNTQLQVSYKGSDGVVRSGVITLT